MKILHLSNSDLDGGGSVVTYRLHKALLDLNLKSTMYVNDKKSKDSTVLSKNNSLDKIKNIFKNSLVFQLRKVLKINHAGTLSINYFNSNVPKKIDNIETDIIHLHSVNKEMLSINQIAKLNKPTIWTFMDMWPFCGAEHYTESDEYINGYKNTNKFNLNFRVWKKKNIFIENKFRIVCLSDWLTKKAKESFLYKNFDIQTIPPCINTFNWKMIDKKLSRKILDLDDNANILLFSSANGTADKRKGFDFLLNVLNDNYFKKNNFFLVIIGELDNKLRNKISIKFKNYLLNTTDNEIIFRLIYSAADLFMIPSRQEALGQTIIEAGSCNTGSIGFKNTGVEQVIMHKESGYLSDHEDEKDFFNGIKWCFSNIKEDNNTIGSNARKNVEKNFSNEIISKKYQKIYGEMFNKYIAK